MKRITLTCLILMFVGSLFAQESYYEPLWWIGAYASNSTITCYLYIDDELQEGTNWEIGAYNMDPVAIAYYEEHGWTNICGRGVAQTAATVPHTFYQVVYSADPGQLVVFKLYNHDTGEEVDYVTPLEIEFVGDATLGGIAEPYEMRFYSQGQDMVFGGEGNWNQLENWTVYGEPATRLPIALDYVSIEGICNMGEDAQYATLTIEDGGELYAPQDAEIIATVKKNIAAYGAFNNWYLMSIPVDVENEEPYDYAAAGMLEGEYDLFYFDQNFPGEDIEIGQGEWRNYKYYVENGEPFKAQYNGYLYANLNNTTLSFTGLLYTGANKEYKKITFNNEADQVGVNVIGNPYACKAEFVGGNRIDGFYMMNADRDDVVVYDPEEEAEYNLIEPGAALIAVAGANNNNAKVTFTPFNAEDHDGEEPGIIRNASNNIKVELTSNGVLKDRVFVKAGEGNNCVKFNLRNEGTKLYVPENDKNYSIVYTEANVMPLNFKTSDNGTYTLNITANNYSYLHLIDNMTGADIDLLRTPAYTFEATSNDYATRFKLVFDENASNEIVDSFAYMSNGNLMINNFGEATLQIMDATGRILSTENIQDSYSKSLNLSTGVYLVRLTNGSDVKTQKIVVR